MRLYVLHIAFSILLPPRLDAGGIGTEMNIASSDMPPPGTSSRAHDRHNREVRDPQPPIKRLELRTGLGSGYSACPSNTTKEEGALYFPGRTLRDPIPCEYEII